MAELTILQHFDRVQGVLDEMRKLVLSLPIEITLEDAEHRSRIHQEDLRRIQDFRLIDDDFMNACFDNNIEATELVLRIIMDKPGLKVTSMRTQKSMKNLFGRDVVLDVDAMDETGKLYNIEIQRADRDAHSKRARSSAAFATRMS